MAKAHRGTDGNDQPELLRRLDEKSREELLALLQHLLQRQPALEPLLELLIELPLSSATSQKKQPGKGRERTLDPSSIGSQVASAFYDAGEGWGAASRVAATREQLSAIGKDFADAGAWANAQIVYATLAEETLRRYGQLHDEGQVSWILGECATGLVTCLNAQPTLPQDERLAPGAREALLKTLFDLWTFGNEVWWDGR